MSLLRGIHLCATKRGYFIVQTANVDKDAATIRLVTPGPLKSAVYFRDELRIAVIKARRGDRADLERLVPSSAPKAPAVVSVLFENIVDDFVEFSKANHGADWRDCCLYKKDMFLGWWRGQPAESITPSDIARKLNEETVGKAPATYNRHRVVLSKIFSLALDTGKVSVNPCKKVPKKKENNVAVRFLNQHDEQEEEKIRGYIRSHGPEREPDFDLALNTGMRAGEMYELLWVNVDLSRGIITIPKSKHGEARHIQINTDARRALEQLAQSKDSTGRVVPLLRQQAVPRTSDLSRFAQRWFGHVVKALKINEGIAKRDPNRLKFHSLRHTFASRLVMAGVDIRTVQVLMGHKDIKMTLRYAHLAPGHLTAAVEKLAQYRPRVAAD